MTISKCKKSVNPIVPSGEILTIVAVVADEIS